MVTFPFFVYSSHMPKTTASAPRKTKIPAKKGQSAPKRVLSVRFDSSIIERLDRIAERKGLDRSALIQLAVVEFIEHGVFVQS